MSDNVQVRPADWDDWANETARAMHDCADRGGKLLCELAKIPDGCADQFRKEAGMVLFQAYVGDRTSLRRGVPPEIVAAIEKFERAIREAYSIFLSLPEDWRGLFHFFEVRPGETLDAPGVLSALQREEPWDSIFRRMIRKCADHTGRPPRVAPKRGRGRRRGDRTKDTYPLKTLIWKLARVVRRHGGRLTLYSKEQRGTWVDALNGLRLWFPEGFIPNTLPLSMIEEVQAKANKFPLKSEFPKKSPD